MDKVNARVRVIRFLYGLLAAGLLVCIVLQVFLAGMGIFVDADNLNMHRTFANTFELVPLVMFVLSFFGQIRGGLRWLALVTLAFSILQHVTIRAFTGPLQALHAVDALVLFGLSWHMARRSWRWLVAKPTNHIPG